MDKTLQNFFLGGLFVAVVLLAGFTMSHLSSTNSLSQPQPIIINSSDGVAQQKLGGTTADDWNVGGNLTVTGTTNLTGAATLSTGTFTTANVTTLAVSGSTTMGTTTLSVKLTGTSTPLTLVNTATPATSTATRLLYQAYNLSSVATSTGSIDTKITNMGGLGTGGSASMLFSVLTSGLLTEKMRLTSDGYLGIGTQSPAYTLDVSGTGRITGAMLFSSTVTTSATTTTSGLVSKNSTFLVKGSDSTTCYDIGVSNGSVITAATSTATTCQ